MQSKQHSNQENSPQNGKLPLTAHIKLLESAKPFFTHSPINSLYVTSRLSIPLSNINRLAFFTISGRTRNSRRFDSLSTCCRRTSSSISFCITLLVCDLCLFTYLITISRASSGCAATHSHPLRLAAANLATSARWVWK